MKSWPAGFLGGFSDRRLMLKAAVCVPFRVCVHGVPVYVGNRFSLMESAWKDCDGKLFCSSNPNNASKHRVVTTRVVSVSHSGEK